MSRLELSSPLAVNGAPSFDILTQWIKDSNILNLHPDLSAVWSEAAGWTVQALQPISRGQRLLSIRKDDIFSLRTAPFSSIVPPPVPDEEGAIDAPGPSSADANLHLAACLLFELRKGKDSKWWAHWQILPRETVLLPVLWAEEGIADDGRRARELLKGTEGEKLLHAKVDEGLGMDAIRQYHARIAASFPPTASHPHPPSLADYTYALSMVSTRGFLIDSYHIIGLIPFADLFNHSSTRAHTSVATDMHVCGTCGAYGACAHWDPEAEGGESTRPATRGADELAGKVVEMWAERDVAGPAEGVGHGTEMWSCYEPHLGWAKMLVEWGFVPGEEEGMSDAGPGITWSPRQLLDSTTVRWFLALTRGDDLWVEFNARMGELRGQHDTRTSERVSLIAAPWTDSPSLLNATPAGAISINLIIVACLQDMAGVGELEGAELEDVALRILTVCLELEGEGAQGRQALAQRAAERLAGLFQARIEQQAMARATTEELRAALGALQSPAGLQRMSMRLLIQERIALETAIHRLHR